MAFCEDPGKHRAAWWADPAGFTRYDRRRGKVVPSRIASMHCEVCHRHWGTLDRDLVASMPTRRPGTPARP